MSTKPKTEAQWVEIPGVCFIRKPDGAMRCTLHVVVPVVSRVGGRESARQRPVVGTHGSLEEGELDQEAAERFLFGDRFLVEFTEPDSRIGLRSVEGPQE
ncbi:hypothetical protein ACIHCV_37880 [Streptomyces sp. NPDC051956]|uniref:hypothetical protein n=1 Tax=Streptomyces sp. NPDC051956 TaxID=3365677 RepID=UPI0037D0093D